MAKKTKLSDLRTQRQNANKHTERGIKALDKAIVENGWIGAATIAANGETFDGSARLEVLKKRFGDDIDPIIVDCDGTRPVFVRRTDIADTDDPKAQLLSVQANRIAQIDLDWNPDVLADIAKRVKLSSVFEEEELTFIMSKEQRASLVAGLKDKWESEGVEGDDEVADTLQDDDSGYSDDDDIDDEELGDRTDVKYSGGDRVENEYSGDRAINGKPIESEQEKAERLAKDAELLAKEAESTIEILEQIETIQSRVKLGEIWALGRHRILAGDCTVEANVRALLGDRVDDVGMIWSDPPYGMSVVKNEMVGAVFNGSLAKKGKYQPVIGDESGDVAIKAFSTAQIFKCKQFWWGGNWYSSLLPSSSCWVIWDKRCDSGIENTFADCELCWTNMTGTARIYRQLWNGMIREGEHEKRVHPTQKPVRLFTWCAEKYGSPNDIIVDLFLGSGISIIGCEKLNDDRTVYGCELSLDYCEVIIRRWEKFTGQTAVLIGSL